MEEEKDPQFESKDRNWASDEIIDFYDTYDKEFYLRELEHCDSVVAFH